MTRMTGGGALVEMLRRHEIDTLFALPGVQNDALFVAFYDAGEALRVIHTRHEQGAAYMAFGYARASGKVVTTPKADVWRFANGKAVEFYEFFDTAQVVAAMS